MEKYGTYEIYECESCHEITHKQPNSDLPVCNCVKEKIASGDPAVPAWKHRIDLEEKEENYNIGHA